MLYRIVDINDLNVKQKSLPEEPCPIFTKPHHKKRRRKRASENANHDDNVYYILREENKVLLRKPLIPIYDYYPTYVIWTSNITQVSRICKPGMSKPLELGDKVSRV